MFSFVFVHFAPNYILEKVYSFNLPLINLLKILIYIYIYIYIIIILDLNLKKKIKKGKQMKNKKIILGLATVSTVIAPLATVISCGFGKEKVVQFPEEITGITFKGANKHGSIDHKITPIIGVVITTDKDANITLTDGEAIIATYTLQKNYSWNDGTNDPKTLTTNVSGLANKTIAIPTEVTGLTFTGSQGHGSIDHKVTKIDHVKITTNQDESNTLSDGNEVVVTYKLEEDYYWADGTNDPKKNTIKVSGLKEKTVNMPSTVEGLTFKGANGQGSIDHKVTKIDHVTISYSKEKDLSNNDVITVTYKLNDGYYWDDGSTSIKTLKTTVHGLQNGNAFIGTWKSQANKAKFLNLKNTDKITANIFLGESNLTGLTITTGIITDQNAIAGTDSKPGAKNIVSLTINQPNLTIIPKDSFSFLRNLKNLNLSKCTNLEIIGANSFKWCPIEKWDLNKLKKLKIIKTFSFKIVNLKTLDLSGCTSLEVIEKFNFNESFLITKINLSGCSNLKSIGEQCFMGSRLTYIDLSGCVSLTYLGDQVFNVIVNHSDTQIYVTQALKIYIESNKRRLFQNWKVLKFKFIVRS